MNAIYFYKKETKDKFIKLMEKRYSFENDVLKTIEKNHPNLTDQERKQIFLDWLYPKTTNDYEDLLND